MRSVNFPSGFYEHVQLRYVWGNCVNRISFANDNRTSVGDGLGDFNFKVFSWRSFDDLTQSRDVATKQANTSTM